MCLTLELSGAVREKLGVAVSLLGCVLAAFGICLIGLAVYIKLHIETRMIVMDGYDTGTLPFFLIAVGIMMLVLDLVVAKIAFDSGYTETQERYKNSLLFIVVLCFIILWFVLAGSLLCFSHRGVIEESLKNGLYNILQSYKKDLTVKVTIDKIQQEYHCCGSEGYLDWFNVNWVNEESLNTQHPDVLRKLQGGLYYTDDAPFSCCDVSSPRPCVHHNVNNKSYHGHYGDVTLYKSGCTPVLMEFIDDKLLLPTGWATLGAFFTQMILLVLLRYLQTSLSEAYLQDDPDGPGIGYCCPGCICCEKGNPMKYVGRDNRDAESGGGGGFDFDPGQFDDLDSGHHDHHNKDKNKKDKHKNKDGKSPKSDKHKKDKKGAKESSKSHNKSKKGSPKSKKGSPKSKKGSPKSKKGSPKAKKGSPKMKKKSSPKKMKSKKMKKPKSPKAKKAKMGGKKKLR